jgi:hypothetical protein
MSTRRMAVAAGWLWLLPSAAWAGMGSPLPSDVSKVLRWEATGRINSADRPVLAARSS